VAQPIHPDPRSENAALPPARYCNDSLKIRWRSDRVTTAVCDGIAPGWRAAARQKRLLYRRPLACTCRSTPRAVGISRLLLEIAPRWNSTTHPVPKSPRRGLVAASVRVKLSRAGDLSATRSAASVLPSGTCPSVAAVFPGWARQWVEILHWRESTCSGARQELAVPLPRRGSRRCIKPTKPRGCGLVHVGGNSKGYGQRLPTGDHPRPLIIGDTEEQSAYPDSGRKRTILL
jgi:hypothetical protein